MLDHLSGATRLYPIIGDPIVHVKTPKRLTSKFAERGHDGICMPMQVRAGDLDAVMAGLTATRNVDGLLFTMQHKNAVFAHCATSSETSKLLEVVSVARRNPDGTWHGDMLDGLAFVEAMRKRGARSEGARVLQVGAGGVGGAIAVALLDAGVRELVLNDTNQGRLDHLVDLLSGRGRVTGGSPDPTGFDIVCNATPMGLSPDDPLPVQGDLLRSSMFVGDVIAGEGITPLIEAARAAGCKTSDGAHMVEAVLDVMPDFLLGR